MANAGIRRNHFEILKRRLTPAQERITFHVALKLQFRIQAECIDIPKIIHLHGMVNHQLGGKQRIDALRIAAHALHGFAHGGEIDDRGHPCEIL